MPVTPLTHETAKVGDIFTATSGRQFKKVLSPYANDGVTTMNVLQDAEGGSTAATAIAPPRRKKAAPVVKPAAQAPVAAVAPPAVVAPVAGVQPVAAPDPAPVELPHDDNQEEAHKAELATRQAAADAHLQAEDDFHAEIAATPPAAPKPALPTIDVKNIQQAGFLPITPAMGADIGRGILETPSMIGLGARDAVRNIVGFSDHIGDLVEEHVPGTLYWKGFDHNPDTPHEVGITTAAKAREMGLPDNRPGAMFDRALPLGPEDHPHSVTGGLVKGVAQFTTGMLAGGAALKGWKVAAGTGTVVKAMAEGAIADFGAFDAHQARLSDFLKKVAPDAVKPVFEYLSSDPRDGEVEGRLKNALEGLGLGLAMQGIISAARQLRAGRLAQRAAAIQAEEEGLQGVIDAPQSVLEAEAAKFHEDLGADVGDPLAEGFVINRKFPLKPGEVARVADAGEMGPNAVGLNYAKIADSSDMQAAAVQFYDAFHPEITAAKRGVQSIEQQIDDAFGADVTRLLGEWKPGKAMASHELTALRFAQAAAMKDFLAHARAIGGGDSSLAKQAAFLQTGGVLDAMTRAVEGGKAEAARTLRTLRETIPSMVGDVHTSADAISFYRKVDALVAGAGGKEMVERAAKAFLTVAKHNPLGTSKFLRFIDHYGKFNSSVKEHLSVFMTNGLLSIPGNTANIIGNASAMIWEPMMRTLAPHLSDAVGATSHIAHGEGWQMMVGMKAAFGDIFRLSEHINAGTDIKAHLGLLNLDHAKSQTKAFASYEREEVSRATEARLGPGIERGPESDTALGRVARFVWGGIKIPGHINGLMDDFTKIISGRAELHAQAYRQAMKDAETGLITRDQVGVQMTKHMEDPSAAMLEKVIFAQKELSWTREADTKLGDFTKALTGLRAFGDSIPVPMPLGTSILPFVRTPANVFSYGMRNSAFAPLSARWFEEIRSADGATRQLALTKYAAGSLATLWVMDHVATGQITGGGPKDPAQRAAMTRVDPVTHNTLWQPYSIRVGDRWFDYSRLDPAATPLSVAADVSEGWLGNDWTDDRAQSAFEVFSAGSMSVGAAFMNKSTMQGMSQLMDAISSSQQGGTAKAETFMEKRALSMMLFSSALGSFRRQEDPYQREVSGLVDAFKNDIPGLSSTLPESFDLWGRPRTYESGLGSVYDFLVPMRTHQIGGEPADREMLRLGYARQMPSRTLTLPGGRSVNLRNYPTIANEILTRGGPEALQEINDLVTGASPNSDYYNSLADGSDQNAPGSKARYLRGRLDFHYGQAARTVKQDFADDLQQIAQEQARRRAEVRSPQPPPTTF